MHYCRNFGGGLGTLQHRDRPTTGTGLHRVTRLHAQGDDTAREGAHEEGPTSLRLQPPSQACHCSAAPQDPGLLLLLYHVALDNNTKEALTAMSG